MPKLEKTKQKPPPKAWLELWSRNRSEGLASQGRKQKLSVVTAPPFWSCKNPFSKEKWKGKMHFVRTAEKMSIFPPWPSDTSASSCCASPACAVRRPYLVHCDDRKSSSTTMKTFLIAIIRCCPARREGWSCVPALAPSCLCCKRRRKVWPCPRRESSPGSSAEWKGNCSGVYF